MSQRLLSLPHGEQGAFLRGREEGWDFRGEQATRGVYGIHPYPAMFHYGVVRRLLQQFSKRGDMVLDPFAGSGVAAVESAIAERRFYGCDINPLAILVARVRSTPLPRRELLATLDETLQKAPSLSAATPDFHNLRFWFSEQVIAELSSLRAALFALPEGPVRDFFLVSFSEAVRLVSRTRPNEFKLLRRKEWNKFRPDVAGEFERLARRNIDLLDTFYRDRAIETPPTLEVRDVLDGLPLPDNSVDLVITSPPYGDSRTTVAYGQFSRLSLQWLGLEERVDKKSLGRSKATNDPLPSETLYEVLARVEEKNAKRAGQVLSFYQDLNAAVTEIARVVKPGGRVCFVVGNRRVAKTELPTDRISADFFCAGGFTHQETIVRAISNKRMPAENAPSNIPGQKERTMAYEYLVLLRKPP